MPGPPLRVPVYYDFASTLSYVAHRVLGRLGDRLGAAGIGLTWRPVDLADITGWARGATLGAAARARARDIARALVGDVRMPPVWIDSRGVNGVALLLGDTPPGAAWRERVWTGVYEEGQDPVEPGAIGRWARDVGIDLDTLGDGDDALAFATGAASDAGVVAVPTVLLGEWPMAGIQDDETMLALLVRFAARQA